MPSGGMKFTFNGSELQLIAALNLTNQRMIEACTNKMTFLMDKLYAKLLSGGPGTIPRVLAQNLKGPEVTVESGNIIGTLSWEGRTSDYIINAVGKATGLTGPGQKRGGTRSHKGGPRRFGKDVLHFFWGGPNGPGKEVYLENVKHPPFPGPVFMIHALEQMRNEIKLGISQAITETVRSYKTNY